MVKMLLEIPDQYADQAAEAIPRTIHNRFRGMRGWIQDIQVEKLPVDPNVPADYKD
jgi:hypothetical protein